MTCIQTYNEMMQYCINSTNKEMSDFQKLETFQAYFPKKYLEGAFPIDFNTFFNANFPSDPESLSKEISSTIELARERFRLISLGTFKHKEVDHFENLKNHRLLIQKVNAYAAKQLGYQTELFISKEDENKLDEYYETIVEQHPKFQEEIVLQSQRIGFIESCKQFTGKNPPNDPIRINDLVKITDLQGREYTVTIIEDRKGNSYMKECYRIKDFTGSETILLKEQIQSIQKTQKL